MLAVALRGRPRRSASRPPVRIALCALLLAPAAACSEKETVHLGLPYPKGDVYGENTRMGAMLAVEEINAKGGAGGRKIELIEADDQGDGQRAIAVAEEYGGDERVVAVVGHVFSGTTRAAASAYERHRLPAVATSATATDISALGPYTFRVASSDSANAVVLARAAGGMGRRTAVLYSNDDYGRGLARNFSTALRAAGGTVLGEDPYLDTMPDFGPYIERLKRRQADLVFVAGIDEGAAKLIPQADRMGLGARFMGGDGLEALVSRGAGFDGTVVGLLYHPDASPRARAFAEAYRARYAREPDSSAALAYDAVKLLAGAIAAGRTDREGIRGWLEAVGRDGAHPVYQGVAGPVAFDANGDPKEKGFNVGVIQNGRIQLLRGQR